MDSRARAIFLESVRCEIYPAALHERSWRAGSKWRAGLHSLRQRHVYLHRPGVLSSTAGRRPRRIPLVYKFAERLARSRPKPRTVFESFNQRKQQVDQLDTPSASKNWRAIL